MKFATHVLAFGQDKWIMKNIENSYPHVDKIYIAYSEKPWIYNKNARELYSEPMNLDNIRESKFYDKIEIIESVWDTEEDQRNSCVEYALNDGIDYLFIHDADEFYFHKGFEQMKSHIMRFPNHNLYRCGWYNFWKDMNITIKKDGTKIAGYPDVCINLNNKMRFVNKRTSTSDNINVISDVICYHLSYVMNNDEILKKLKTWGHTNDFDHMKWYNDIWLGWTEEKTGLHPIQPNEWYKAVKYDGDLPEVLC